MLVLLREVPRSVLLLELAGAVLGLTGITAVVPWSRLVAGLGLANMGYPVVALT
jgi:hypothetical protein